MTQAKIVTCATLRSCDTFVRGLCCVCSLCYRWAFTLIYIDQISDDLWKRIIIPVTIAIELAVNRASLQIFTAPSSQVSSIRSTRANYSKRELDLKLTQTALHNDDNNFDFHLRCYTCLYWILFLQVISKKFGLYTKYSIYDKNIWHKLKKP
jgi:hypothetical protein